MYDERRRKTGENPSAKPQSSAGRQEFFAGGSRALFGRPRIKIIYSIVDNVIYIEYIKNTWLSEETMLKRMGYFWE